MFFFFTPLIRLTAGFHNSQEFFFLEKRSFSFLFWVMICRFQPLIFQGVNLDKRKANLAAVYLYILCFVGVSMSNSMYILPIGWDGAMWSNVQNPPVTFQFIGWLTGILKMAYYNPFRTGKSPIYPKKRGLFHCSCGPFRPLNWGHGGICSLPVHDVCGNISRGIYLHLDDFNGTCRCIYLTWILWILWVFKQLEASPSCNIHITTLRGTSQTSHHPTTRHFQRPNQNWSSVFEKTTKTTNTHKNHTISSIKIFQQPQDCSNFSNFGNQPTSKTPVFPGNPKKRLENLGFFQPPPRNSGP